MAEQDDFTLQEDHRNRHLTQRECSTELQAPEIANGDPATTDDMAREARASPLEGGGDLTAQLSGDKPETNEGEAAADYETEGQHFVVALKLPSGGLATLGSAKEVKASVEASENIHPGSIVSLENLSATTIPIDEHERPMADADLHDGDFSKDDPEAETSEHRIDVLDALEYEDYDAAELFAKLDSADQFDGDARANDDQITKKEISDEQKKQIKVGAAISKFDHGEAIMISSSPTRGTSNDHPLIGENDDAAKSAGHVSDKELLVVRTSGVSNSEKQRGEKQRERSAASRGEGETREPDISASLAQADGLSNVPTTFFNVMTPGSFQKSQTNVPSPQGTRQAIMQHDNARRALKQAKASRLPQDVADFRKQEFALHIERLEHEAQQRKNALIAARAKTLEKAGNLVPGRGPPPTPKGPPPPAPVFSNDSHIAQGYAQGYTQMFPQYPDYGYPGPIPHNMAPAQYPSNGYVPQASSSMLYDPMGPMTPDQYHLMLRATELQSHRNTLPDQTQRQYFQDQAMHSESNSDDLPMISQSRPRPSAQHQEPKQPTTNTNTNTTATHPNPNPESSSSTSSPFDFALPPYEIQPQPPLKKDDVPRAKISIPGLIREELLLSPDHAAQELHLLCTLFLPTQEALPTPDPEPAVAVLNFHTIALMVIEAYVQFEIGDEFGTGRGHWHNEHDHDDEGEYVRLRDAKDADPNEIFFAVIDRWRAGIESGRKGVGLIRGAQEFCDVALDVIYYVKENGLLRVEPKVGKTRGKGKGRGRADDDDDGGEGGGAKGKKRGAQKVVNEVQPRKKAKASPAKGKSKSSVSVVKKK
ncbi:hypothetical protein NX059_009821 [Plenodomus lindquistii]|nr:hypothetical protein NX059_009821 [Plenodomus lindquistii]